MLVYNWDEVTGEVTTHEIEILAETKNPEVIYTCINIDLQIVGQDQSHEITELPTLTLVTGRYGIDKEFMMWWGDEATCTKFRAVVEA